MIKISDVINFLLVLLTLMFVCQSAQASRQCGVFRSQILCDAGQGPVYSGDIRFTHSGFVDLSLFDLPPGREFSCELFCGLGDATIYEKNCLTSGEDGKIRVQFGGFWESLGESCQGVSVTIRDREPGNISCELGLVQAAKGACIRKRTVNNSVVTITCRKAGCQRGSQCNVIKYGGIHPRTGTDTGKKSAICRENIGEVCTCSCR